LARERETQSFLEQDVGEVSFVRCVGLLALARGSGGNGALRLVLPVQLARKEKPLTSRAASESVAFEAGRRARVLAEVQWEGGAGVVHAVPHTDVMGVSEGFQRLTGEAQVWAGRLSLQYVVATRRQIGNTPWLGGGRELPVACSSAQQAGLFNAPLAYISMMWGNVRGMVHPSTHLLDARSLQMYCLPAWESRAPALMVVQHADLIEASEAFTWALSQPGIAVLCLPNAEGMFREALAVVEDILAAFAKQPRPTHTPTLVSALQFATEQASQRVGMRCTLFI
jgi:hypothetical protein